MCSHVDCLPLPSCYLIIVSVAPAVSPSLPSFVSLYSSPCVCSPVLIRCLSCVVCYMWVLCLTVLQSSACLLVFPLRGGFCSSLFYIIIKRTISSAFESSTPSLTWHKREEISVWITISRSLQYNTNTFVTYTITQSIMRSEMCSLHLTHPSGAVGSRHCSAFRLERNCFTLATDLRWKKLLFTTAFTCLSNWRRVSKWSPRWLCRLLLRKPNCVLIELFVAAGPSRITSVLFSFNCKEFFVIQMSSWSH